MNGFSIQFSHPWLLLLIVPLVGVALLLYFKSNKKFRRTRNRITSLILHCVVSVLCVSVLAGVYIRYEVSNDTNELIFLVDASESSEQAKDTRDRFMVAALETGTWYDGFKIGVVTFGFDQVYAVPLTTDVDGIYEQYQRASLPSEQGGTDIAAALTYTSHLFSESSTAKIVLVTDGKETDESALEVVSSLASRGIAVDTAHIASSFLSENETDLQITGVEFPDYHLEKEDQFTLGCVLGGTSYTSFTVNLYDNDELVQTKEDSVVNGSRTIEFQYAFQEEGLHELCFEVTSKDDAVEANNVYYSYYYVENYDRILIIERGTGESEALRRLLEEKGEYDVSVLNLYDQEATIPTDAQQLCEYDQVILNNIANKDMPTGFIDVLYDYVYDYGGGMLTVGGEDESGENNAYNRSDMYGTVYQSMLPVEIINYTPPVAVMIIIDASGSMGSEFDNGESYLAWARAGASACLDSLSERDYIGVMALNSLYDVVLPLTQRTQDHTIRSAISSIDETGGGTVFSEAINRAGSLLRAQTNVARRHIIIVTDGGASLGDEEQYLENISTLNKDGITLSVVGIGVTPGSTAAVQMQKAVDAGGGRLHAVTDSEDLVLEMREDLNAPEIKDMNEYENGFNPIAYQTNSILFDGVTLEDKKMSAVLGGFYGSRVKSTDYLILAGDFDVPLYAQWKFGAGSVGSFMCSLDGGKWSGLFMSDAGGAQFILNMVRAVMPVTNIEPSLLDVELDRENFINKLSIYTQIEEGQTIRGKLIATDWDGDKVQTSTLSLNTGEGATEDCYVTQMLDANNGYSRCNFVVKRGGAYQLLLEVCDSAGEVLYSYSTYFDFSFSKEYDLVAEAARPDAALFLEQLAEKGRGESIADMENPVSIFDNFIMSHEMRYDPRVVLLIASILLFLLDIAVRKFKFKWIHEIVRERRMIKDLKKGKAPYAEVGATRQK